MMQRINIEDHEIELAEQLLLSAGESFDDQRRVVIRCMESKDIQACPGSGKTTALLAKLSILSQKLPLKDNKGICVLTHTNVAVNEIKERLEDKADILFEYPNHFGTIQSFVNKYLAIPAFINKFGKRPARIDDEIYHEYVERKQKALPFGTRKYLETKNIDLTALRFSIIDFNIISKTIDGPLVLGKNTATYQQIKRLKEDILNEGILCYDDAYSLSYWYMREYPNLRDIISERFAYIFIDEMQDTDAKQQGILDMALDPDKVIVQRIGDTNQAIYNSSWQIREGYLSISDSKRFSPVIAEKVKNICPIPQKLNGNPAIENIQPKFIVFDDSSIANVIPKFGDLILENNLDSAEKKIYKAVGWVGKTNTKRTIPSYFESFSISGRKEKEDYDSLLDYLKAVRDRQHGQSVSTFRKYIIAIILKCLRLLGIKKSNGIPYTETSFIELVSKENTFFYDKLNLKILHWCQEIYRIQDISSDLKEFIKVHLCTQFEVTLTPELTAFLEAPTTITLALDQKADIYNHTREHKKINIDVCNIHSVKGETHTATLYLETFYYQYDIQSIIEYMKGNHKPPKGSTLQSGLKMAYVGMTRPTHMLCVAAHTDGCENHLDDLSTSGWDIHRI
jgi:hypothetical protein